MVAELSPATALTSVGASGTVDNVPSPRVTALLRALGTDEPSTFLARTVKV